MSVSKISDVLHREYKIADEPGVKDVPQIQVANTEGVARCRFDLFVRYTEAVRRNKKAFTYRGDHFGETDPAKMLWNLIRMFKNKYQDFLLAELYDNTRQKNDPDRLILRYKSKQIIVNRLSEYSEMLKEHPLPDWLK